MHVTVLFVASITAVINRLRSNSNGRIHFLRKGVRLLAIPTTGRQEDIGRHNLLVKECKSAGMWRLQGIQRIRRRVSMKMVDLGQPQSEKST